MKRTKRVIPISIAMPADMARRIRVLAAQEDKSRSQFVREVLERELCRVEDQRREAQHG